MTLKPVKTDVGRPSVSNRSLKDTLYEQVARITNALASPKRLELLELLTQAPQSVEALAAELGISVKLASAHLKALRVAQLVETQRHGKYIIYRLSSPFVPALLVMLRNLAEGRLLELQQAVGQLARATAEWQGESREALLNKARNGDVVVIDVRPAREYEHAHLPYARSLPLAELRQRLAELPPGKPVVAYCRGPYCLMSADAVRILQAHGIEAVQLRAGINEWQTIAAA